MNGIIKNIEKLWGTDIDDVPEKNRFLLELDFDQLMQSGICNKTYWVVALEAVIVAGQRRAVCNIQERTQLSKRSLKSTKARLGIIDTEKEILTYDWSYTVSRRG